MDSDGNAYPTFATAPAQRVTISDPLSPHLDWSTFQLVELGFGDTRVPIPAGRTHYAGSVPMTYNGRTFDVELEAGIDLASGRVFAVFQSINPETSLPPDVLTGFLPPEDGTGRGKGHFSFLIRPRAGLPTATEIRNVALIEFDRQMTIATDQRDPQNPGLGVDPDKQALNSIDASPPTSAVATLPPTTPTVTFPVSWSGADAGSGIAGYDIYASTNAGPWGLWLHSTTNQSAMFNGRSGDTYAFFSIARDLVGYVEPAPEVADAITRVEHRAPTVLLSASLRPSADGESVLVELSYPVAPGWTHTVEFRDALDAEPGWQALPGGPHNNGSVTDTTLSNHRYYRLRME